MKPTFRAAALITAGRKAATRAAGLRNQPTTDSEYDRKLKSVNRFDGLPTEDAGVRRHAGRADFLIVRPKVVAAQIARLRALMDGRSFARVAGTRLADYVDRVLWRIIAGEKVDPEGEPAREVEPPNGKAA